MRDTTRRSFLKHTALSAVPLLLARSAEATGPVKNLGVQLYTVRDLLPKDSAATLKAIAAMGYREVEVIRRDLDRIAPELRRVGLKPVSMHIEAPLVTGKWDAWRAAGAAETQPPTLASVIAGARKHGVRYLVVSYIFPQERGGADFYRQFSDQMNRAGEECRRAGLTLCYHNHAFEFAPVDSTLPFEILTERFDPRLVKFELDLFWLAMAGMDPGETLKKFAGRVPLVHLKDKARGAAPQKQEAAVPKTAFAEVGSGELDFPSILREAAKAGVKHYFVEQDQTPGNPLDSLRKSYEYLSRLKA